MSPLVVASQVTIKVSPTINVPFVPEPVFTDMFASVTTGGVNWYP